MSRAFKYFECPIGLGLKCSGYNTIMSQTIVFILTINLKNRFILNYYKNVCNLHIFFSNFHLK